MACALINKLGSYFILFLSCSTFKKLMSTFKKKFTKINIGIALIAGSICHCFRSNDHQNMNEVLTLFAVLIPNMLGTSAYA